MFHFLKLLNHWCSKNCCNYCTTNIYLLFYPTLNVDICKYNLGYIRRGCLGIRNCVDPILTGVWPNVVLHFLYHIKRWYGIRPPLFPALVVFLFPSEKKKSRPDWDLFLYLIRPDNFVTFFHFCALPQGKYLGLKTVT